MNTAPHHDSSYRGRIAPTPSGWLHEGHAATFRTAWERARACKGKLVYRTEDLDGQRCRPVFAAAAMEDLRWCGLDWDEGPDCGGPRAPYVQSERFGWFREVFERLCESGLLYPSPHSRAEIRRSKPGISPANGEPVFPPALRPERGSAGGSRTSKPVNWRFRVPDGRRISFEDGRCGRKTYQAGVDFGDFLVWRKDGVPSYELAVVADDHAMEITEVVRGEDLLVSTARQLLLYEALGWEPPAWFHCPLVLDPETGVRLSKTAGSRSLRAGRTPRRFSPSPSP
ncbi:MAG: glutamate--tRNA ligase family protein [Oceanipulchritudo sp.]